MYYIILYIYIYIYVHNYIYIYIYIIFICIIHGPYLSNHQKSIQPPHLRDGRQAVWHVGKFQAGAGGQVAGELAGDLRGDIASEMVMVNRMVISWWILCEWNIICEMKLSVHGNINEYHGH